MEWGWLVRLPTGNPTGFEEATEVFSVSDNVTPFMCTACSVYQHKWAYKKAVNSNGNPNLKCMVVSNHWTAV